MNLPTDDAVHRFRLRTRGTDEATLHRNLEAGVYGPPGSARRAVAERALNARFSEVAQALQSAGGEEGARLRSQIDRLERTASRTMWLAVGALTVAVVALLVAL